jgi:hypothetical protein
MCDAIAAGDIGLRFASIKPSNGFPALMWREL